MYQITSGIYLKYLVGADLGTSGVKLYITDYEGRVVTVVREKYGLIFRGPDIVEQNPEDWWNAFSKCLRKVAEKYEVSAIALSSQANTLLLLDEKGRVLSNAISWLDQRSFKEVNELIEAFGLKYLHQKTGMIPNPGFTAPKLLWLKKNKKDLLSRAKKILFSPQSYIAYKLTGKIAVDRSLASFSMLYDIRKEDWLSEVVEFTGIEADLLPTIHYSYEVVGHIRSEIAFKLRLSTKIPVIIGAHDQCCAALGAGVYCQGPVVDSTGTAGVILYVAEKLPEEIPESLLVYHYVFPGKWTALGTLSASGALIDWLIEFTGRKLSHEEFEREAEKVPAGSNGVRVVPYFSGSFRPGVPPDARGAILGLTLFHKPHHVYRAIMEAIAFELKYYLETIKNLGYPLSKVIAVGGGAKSRLWRKIKANVFELPVLKPKITDTAPLGACILAGIGSGAFKNIEDAMRIVSIEEEVKPNKELIIIYRKLYKNYLDLFKKICLEQYEV